MTETTVKQLPEDTVKLITSTQIVTSVSTTVKELVENSIDAGAKVIQVRLENHGLDLIEVKDDGSGVSYDNVQRMFLPGYTSKIQKFEDLGQLDSYGFRGEALAAICKIAKVSITTRTKADSLAMTYEIDSTGLPVSSKPSHLSNGTVIAVSSLFSNLPVRRLFLASKKKMSEDLKKTEHVVQSLSLIHPELGLLLIHNKCPIWKKNSVKGIKQSFMQVAGLKSVSKMDHLFKDSKQISIDLIIPKKNLENTDPLFTNSPQSLYVYVNKRPIVCKNLSQPVQEHIFHHYSKLNISFKYSVCLVSVYLSPQQVDINLEPNKTKALLKNQNEVIKLIDETLRNYYGNENFTCSALKDLPVEEEIEECEVEEQPLKRPRLDSQDKSVGEMRNKVFKEKNQDWSLDIINEDCSVNSDLSVKDLFPNPVSEAFSGPQGICSQINARNSVLTKEEVSKLFTVLNDTNQKLVTSTNSSNSETRLVERCDIQSRSVEKPILQDWPCRPKVVVESQTTTSLPNVSESVERITEVENISVETSILPECPSQSNTTGLPEVSVNKSAEEIVDEIAKEAESWSIDMIKAMQNVPNNEESAIHLDEEVGQFDLSMQSVSSQMGKKEMKAFTKFARIMRPKIMEEYPNIVFTQVADILAKRWKNLTPDEVKYYEKMAEVVDTNRKIHQEAKQTEIPKPKEPSKGSKNKDSNLKSLLERLNKKTKINRPPRSETPLTASVTTVKELRTQLSDNLIQDDFLLIGQLQPSGNWLYKRGNEIGHVRHQGLLELVASQKMLSNYSIPRKPVDKCILINEECLGMSLWDALVSLDTKIDPESSKCVIQSSVVEKNGFQIEVFKTEGTVTSARITEVAALIPHFGVSELKDALRMYLKNGEAGGLASWRPTAVYNYIINEAIRTSQQCTKPPDRKEMETMLNTYHLCLRHLPPLCLHSREIFVPLYNIEDTIISSQPQSQCLQDDQTQVK